MILFCDHTNIKTTLKLARVSWKFCVGWSENILWFILIFISILRNNKILFIISFIEVSLSFTWLLYQILTRLWLRNWSFLLWWCCLSMRKFLIQKYFFVFLMNIFYFPIFTLSLVTILVINLGNISFKRLRFLLMYLIAYLKFKKCKIKKICDYNALYTYF